MADWEWLTLVSRWALYLGMAVALGGIASEWLMHSYRQLMPALKRYTLAGILFASLTLLLHFMIRVGGLAETGLSGMVDPFMLQVMWQSTVGNALAWAVTGLLLLTVSHAISFRTGDGRIIYWLQRTAAVAGMVILAYSFSLSGHVQSGGVLTAAALTVHILIIFCWLGLLFPLWLATHRLGSDQSHRLLDLFGRLALPAVVLLLGAGMLLSYQLAGWDEELLDSRYGFWLLLKLALVGVILTLAVVHKFYLVPALKRGGSARAMKRSLLLEKIVGMAILAVTTVLAVLVGPEH